MQRRFADKAQARGAVWDRLQAERLARFPFPPHGRIPNFAGAKEAATRLFELEPWKSATRLKVNPDAPQRCVREEALRRGITVYVPTPRLRAGFKCLDPSTIPKSKISQAASLTKASEWATDVPLDRLPPMDAIVCGSVAVTPAGRRAGKGEGYSDIEYAILRELGHPPVPVATTVHPVQIVDAFPWDPHDVPLSAIVAPARTIIVDHPPPPPSWIAWDRLTKEDLRDMPVLTELRTLCPLVRRATDTEPSTGPGRIRSL